MRESIPVDSIYLEMLVQDVLKNRRITLNETIDHIEIYKVMHYMDKIKKIDDLKDIPLGKRKPIEIVCNSYGGYLYECLGLVSKMEEFINKYQYEIVTTLTGKAMSCGQMVFMFGTKRRVYKYGTCMIHQLSSCSYGNFTQLEISHNESVRLQAVVNKMILNKTKISKELLDTMIQGKDWYLNAEESIKYGLADEII